MRLYTYRHQLLTSVIQLASKKQGNEEVEELFVLCASKKMESSFNLSDGHYGLLNLL